MFDVQVPEGGATPTVTISGLDIFGGFANSNNGSFGGDVRNQATLTLTEDSIEDGETQNGSGAGVSNDAGTLTVVRSLISDNGRQQHQRFRRHPELRHWHSTRQPDRDRLDDHREHVGPGRRHLQLVLRYPLYQHHDDRQLDDR